MSKLRLQIYFQVEESNVTVDPNTSDIIGRIPTPSKMNIKPDMNTTLRVSTGEGEGHIADSADTEIDVSSAQLNFSVIPAESRITAKSVDTLALVTTNNVEVRWA